MKVAELILDDDQENFCFDKTSVVEHPAIEEDFVALKNQEQRNINS